MQFDLICGILINIGLSASYTAAFRIIFFGDKMSYKINLGCWGSVFAVPSDAVDKYIKIASGSSVKVLLYFLRHSGELLSDAVIASALSMKEEDVSDAFVFWEQVGLLSKSGEEFSPAEKPAGVSDSIFPVHADTEQSRFVADKSDIEKDNSVSVEEQARLAAAKAAALRTPEFSPALIADTVKNDEKMNYLFKTCEALYGRQLKHTEQNALVTITEHIGLPAEVALMLVDFCFSIGKSSPAYLRSAAMDWVENGVTDLSTAEQYISVLQAKNKAENTVKSIFGINRALSQKEKDFASLWINEWGFSSEIITMAYDINVNSKGKYSFPYISTILERWREKGLTTKEQIEEERARNPKQPAFEQSSLDVEKIDKQILDFYS